MKSKSPLEAVEKKKIMAYLKEKEGCWFYKNYSGMGMGTAGIPDLIGVVHSFFLAIEVKRLDGKGTTPLQAQTMLDIKQQGGGLILVAFGYDDFISKFEPIYRQLVIMKEVLNLNERRINNGQ